jgi:hypothetical protein
MKGNLAYQQLNELQKEFEAKNEFLRNNFEEINPADYIDLIYPDKETLVVVFGTLKDKERNTIEPGTVKRISKEDIWGIAWKHNAYLLYCDFKNDFYHSGTLERVRAFVADIDNLTSLNLRVFSTQLNKILLPTCLINSGKGIHLVYHLKNPIYFPNKKTLLLSLNQKIQEKINQLVKVDKHPIYQPYRFPGFTTKINTIATAFKVYKAYPLKELKAYFIDNQKIKPPTSKVIYFPSAKKSFFNFVIQKLSKDLPQEGYRNKTFFALGVIAYKSKREISKEEALQKVQELYNLMERGNLTKDFPLKEAIKAFNSGYQQRYVRTRWETLCEYLNFDFIRQAEGLREKGISLRRISKLIGIHEATLRKWLK